MKTFLFLALPALFLVCNLAFPMTISPLVQVKVKKVIKNNNILYFYEITNRSKKEIVSISVGFDRVNDKPELSVPPVGWGFYKGIPQNSVSSPKGWKCHLVNQEESARHWIQWEVEDENQKGLLPRGKLTGFSITVPKRDLKYENGHYEVVFNDSTYFSASLSGK
jgi:hypothetical protein